MSFFSRYSTKKSLFSFTYFVKKRPFSKKHIGLVTNICRKHVQSLKTKWFHVIFFIFLRKTPCCHAHLLLKKRQYWQHYTILWTKKVNKMLFIPTFHEKISAFMPIFCKKRPFSTIFSQKTSILSKTLCFHSIFFEFMNKKPPAVMPIFGQKKRRFCQNYNILKAKKVNRMAFFRILYKKITIVMPIFCQKTPIL